MKFRARALFAVAVLAAAGCSKGGGGSAASAGPPPLAVDVAKAQRQDIATYISLDGQIAPFQESTLSLPQSGVLVSISVNEGDRVHAGQLLAQLDDSTFRANLAAAQATVAQAEAAVQGSSLTNPITEIQTQSAVTTAEQQLLQARNSLNSAQAAYDTAKIQYESDKSLASQGYLASTTLDQQRSTYANALATLESAKAGIRLAEATVSQAKGNRGQMGVQQADTKAKEAALEQAQAQVKLYETEIAQCRLFSPYDGVVTQRLIDPGALASPNQAIVRVSQLDPVYVNANVPDEQLAYVQTGTPATFTSSSLPGKTFNGRISDVNATPTTGTLSYRARIRQPNPGDLLRGGMLVSLTIRKELHKGAIVVPRTAVFQTDNGANVYTVVDGNKAKAVPVQVGLQTDTETEVHGAGIDPGTTVITTRPDALQDGSVVAVGGPPSAPGAKAH
jgi:multidrug efflux pump subunit AcrA (membrane-fusion protein)